MFLKYSEQPGDSNPLSTCQYNYGNYLIGEAPLYPLVKGVFLNGLLHNKSNMKRVDIDLKSLISLVTVCAGSHLITAIILQTICSELFV